MTSGSGMVAIKHEQYEIKTDERHWHGAEAGTIMGHLTITLAGCCAATITTPRTNGRQLDAGDARNRSLATWDRRKVARGAPLKAL